MKTLHGQLTITLTHQETGEVETISETNLITNAVNDIFSENPCAVFYTAAASYSVVNWYQSFLPICPNLIGGILLFSKALPEAADTLYPAADNLPIAYASNNVNSTTDTRRGSLNLTESTALENGYRFVWEFTPTQGNGTIQALGLTSAFGGAAGFGSGADVTSPFFRLQSVDIKKLDISLRRAFYEAVALDFTQQALWSITYGDSLSAVKIRRYQVPIFSLGLNERLDDSSIRLQEEQVITASTFKMLGSYSYYGEFFDGKDGYWYGFANQGNSSGNATMLWIRIRKDDYSFTEGSWSLAGVKIKPAGKRLDSDTYPRRSTQSVLRNGFLYCMASDAASLYKINIQNPTDVTQIPLGFTSAWRPIAESGESELYLMELGGLIYAWDFILTSDDQVVPTLGAIHFENGASPLFQYKEFLIGWGGNHGAATRDIYLLSPYLASVRNLASPLVKTTDKSMKITYTLTEGAAT